MILGNLGVETDHPPKMCAGLGLPIDATSRPSLTPRAPLSLRAARTVQTDGQLRGLSRVVNFKSLLTQAKPWNMYNT